MESASERLEYFLKKQGWSFDYFVSLIQSPTLKSNASKYVGKNKSQMSSNFTVKFYLAGLNKEWYETGNGPMLIPDEQLIDYTKVPSLISAHKCGFGVSFNDGLEYEDIPTQVIDKMHEPYIITASGSSMYPVIQDGDKVLIERNKQPVNGDIVAVFLNGEYMIKIFDYKQDRLTLFLKSVNPEYKAITIGEHDTFQIFGVAVKFIRDIERIKL